MPERRERLRLIPPRLRRFCRLHRAHGSPRDRNALLLEAMKEELFQLEIDRQQGKISPEEYTKAKAALDETIRRALARGKA